MRQIRHRGWALLALALSLAALPIRPACVRGDDPAPGPRSAGEVPKDTVILELEVPAGAEVRIDGKETGMRRRFEYRPLLPGEMAAHEVEATFQGGEKAKRTVLLRGGWQVRLPLMPQVSRPELVLQTGHASIGYSVAFSPDGKQV